MSVLSIEEQEQPVVAGSQSTEAGGGQSLEEQRERLAKLQEDLRNLQRGYDIEQANYELALRRKEEVLAEIREAGYDPGKLAETIAEKRQNVSNKLTELEERLKAR